MLRKLLIVLLPLATAGCLGSSATVVSSSNGPTIGQAQAAPYNGPKERIAVTSFDYRAGQRSGEIGQGMTDMLTDALFNTNRFIVLERDRLSDVTAEQDLSNSSRFKKDTAAPIGQLEGAQLIVHGAITQFEPNCKGGSIILASAKQACVAINLRIIDAATGRVVNATTVQGTSSSGSVGLIFSGGSLPIGLGAYSHTPMEQAIRQCIESAVNYIVANKM
ncbi:MAG TPA: CsgG/HfaB family protein [Stenotrophobium sp.]|jgi:curli biogenesis system outer membrane secretion channel CsgG|nr:CsgG/HfaB family protein [Stenotrophobium sp.]